MVLPRALTGWGSEPQQGPRNWQRVPACSIPLLKCVHTCLRLSPPCIMVGSLPELWLTSPSLSKVRAGSPGEATACGPGPVPLPIPVGANFRAVLTAASAQPESVPCSALGSVGVSWGVGQASPSFDYNS